MMFSQLAKSESLRDLIIALEAHWRKLYHLGMGKFVTRSNLTKANKQCDHRIFEDFAYHLVAEARSKSSEKIFVFGGQVYAFDSTTIDLCLEVFEWAESRKHKGGVKVHMLYDVKHGFLHSAMSPQRQCMIFWQCQRFYMRKALTISLAEATTTSLACST